jgi:hypothetical protein
MTLDQQVHDLEMRVRRLEGYVLALLKAERGNAQVLLAVIEALKKEGIPVSQEVPPEPN